MRVGWASETSAAGAASVGTARRRGVECAVSECLYQPAAAQMSAGRKALAPDIRDALEGLGRAVFAEGALPEKTKQLIAVAVPNVTQCRNCITGNTNLARRKVASPEESVEAIGVTAEMRAGGAFAHAALVIHAMDQVDAHTRTTAADGRPS